MKIIAYFFLVFNYLFHLSLNILQNRLKIFLTLLFKTLYN